MTSEDDQTYYRRRAEQQLSSANAAVDPTIKGIHLDLASRYATLRELAARGEPNMIGPIHVAIGRCK